MIEQPRIVERAQRTTAVLPLTVPRQDIQTAMRDGIQELMAAVAAQGIAPAGPLFTHHLRAPGDVFDCEIGIPVTSAVQPAGRVKPSSWPAMRVAQTVYQGGYEGLGAAWGEFLGWIAAGGRDATDDFWEVYVVAMNTVSDPSALRTELIKPLRGS